MQFFKRHTYHEFHDDNSVLLYSFSPSILEYHPYLKTWLNHLSKQNCKKTINYILKIYISRNLYKHIATVCIKTLQGPGTDIDTQACNEIILWAS